MIKSKIRKVVNVVFVIGILVTFAYLFLDEHIKIPDVVVGVFAGISFIIISVLGLVSHEVYFTRSEPLQYKNSIMGRVVNIFFGLLGIAFIIMTIISS